VKINRRNFLKITGIAGGSLLAGREKTAEAKETKEDFGDKWGCLIDTTVCLGCRKCEEACNKVNHLPPPDTSFEDYTVFEKQRRPDAKSYTVVNRYFKEPDAPDKKKEPIFVKVQCMHCNDPACVSACIVGALQKLPEGPVAYNASKCIGCRYCMVACPFVIPAYEYHNPLTPKVRKCIFCHEILEKGGLPGCAQVCPVEAITFGKRRDLVHLAHFKIRENPDRYINHVYGEEEVGGTSWMYLASVPFEKLGFQKLGKLPPPRLTETIQHTVFKGFVSPLAFYALLGGVMWITRRKKKNDAGKEE